MIIAKEKKANNIAEYVLYMWQVEDMIRAFNFDITKIKEHIIDKYNQSSEVSSEIEDWYSNLIIMMQDEKITETGHLQFVKNTVNDLYNTHLYLCNRAKDARYLSACNNAKDPLISLVQKNKGESQNDIELSFVALYGYLLLKLQKKEVSIETVSDIHKISTMISYLSTKHLRFEKGEEDMDAL